MQRPISIAMLLSVLLHIAFFLIAEWLIGDRTATTISTPLPVISIQSLQTEADESASDRITDRKAIKVADRELRHSHVSETAIASDINAAELPAKTAKAAVNRKPSSGLERAAARTAAVAASQDAAVARPELATTQTPKIPLVLPGAIRNEPPAFAMAEISPRQETMLKRKFMEWTEHFYRMPEVTDGLSWQYKGQEYLAEFTQLATSDDMTIERVMVVVSTEEDGKRLSTEMQMKRMSFSNYAQFVNRWDRDVQIHDDELDGRFHSNSEINLTYSSKTKPQFHGEVTTSARRVNFSQRRGYVRRDQIFLGGLQTGVKSIRLPKHFIPFPDESDLADEQIHRFAEDAHITFHDDGSFEWKLVGSKSPWHKTYCSGSSCFLVASENVQLHVKGTVNGKVLVYSPERIVIEGNLVYADDPVRVSDADDYLGLASDKYVDVAPADITGPGDLVINAAIYARRRFAVKGYRSRDKALLYIYGSLTAGTLSATEPRYATRIKFDRRLETLRPPRFPMTDRYAIESWDKNWRVEPAATVH